MALSGELKDFGLLQLLTLIQVTAKSGALTLQRAGDTATIYFDGGRLTRAKANGTRAGGLATALYRAGKIDREQYEAISSQALPEKAIALLLEDQGILTRDEVADFVGEKSVADLFSLLTWSEGNFRMEVDSSPPEEDILATTDLAPLLEKGHAYLDEWQLLSSTIPDLESSVRLMAEPLQPTEEVVLSLDEWRMVASLAADFPLKDVAQKLGLDDFAVRQVTYRLINSGLAEMARSELSSIPQFQESMEADQPKSGAFSRLFGQRRK